MHEQLAMLKRYPLLLPMTKDFTAYQGFIHAGDEEFPIGLHVPKYPLLTDLSLCCSWKLSYILQGFENDLRDCIVSCPTLLDYLNTFQHLIESRLESPEVASLLSSARRPPYEVYKKVFDELEGVGFENVVDISNTLERVRLRAEDDAGREHELTLELKRNSPNYVVMADLPLQSMQKLEQNYSLSQLYRTFKDQLTALQVFWDTLDELDRHCWVTDPDTPKRSHTHRRIVIASNVSIQVTVDPYNATLRPDIKFLGSEMGIRPFHKMLAETFEEWSPRASVINNLLDALGLSEFPAPPESPADELQLVRPGECCICYMTRAEDGQLPSQACDNDRCGSHFHQLCLHQWLSTVPTNNTSFNRTYGQCPNCDWAISCPIPSTRASSL